jgi:hypothetical protein
VGELAESVQEATGESVELAYVDQGYTGESAALQYPILAIFKLFWPLKGPLGTTQWVARPKCHCRTKSA